MSFINNIMFCTEGEYLHNDLLARNILFNIKIFLCAEQKSFQEIQEMTYEFIENSLGNSVIELPCDVSRSGELNISAYGFDTDFTGYTLIVAIKDDNKYVCLFGATETYEIKLSPDTYIAIHLEECDGVLVPDIDYDGYISAGVFYNKMNNTSSFKILESKPDVPDTKTLYYIKNFNKLDDKWDSFLGFFVEDISGDTWVSVSKVTQQDLLLKQDVLKAGTGISIDDSNTISTTLDVSLLRVVTELPTEDIDDTKIYLVADNKGVTDNSFKEYIHNIYGWELLGEYKADIDLSPYLTKVDAKKTYMEIPKNGIVTMSFSNNGSMNSFGDNGQAFNAVRECKASITGYVINAASFGVKLDGTTGFSHKKYDTFNPSTGTYTGARNTAVLTFSGPTGIRYAKNTGTANDVTEDMYKFVGVIDSPDINQRVYSTTQTDTLLKTLNTQDITIETSIKPKEDNTVTVGSNDKQFNDIYTKSFSGSKQAVANAISSGDIGSILLAVTNQSGLSYGDIIEGSNLRIANIPLGNLSGLIFDTEGALSGSYKVLNSTSGSENLWLVLVVKIS